MALRGMCRLRCRIMSAFIARMLTVVPLGTESELLDFEAELSELLAA